MSNHTHSAALVRRPIVLRLAATLAFALLAQVLIGLAPSTTPVLGPDPVSAQASKPTAAVMIGDSFTSGEGGRWRGNSMTGTGNRAGTDAAALPGPNGSWTRDPLRTYTADSYANGCHRSFTAPIMSMFATAQEARAAGLDALINLACSGAQTKHVWGYNNGGTAFKGEQPQSAQLYNVAGTHNVKLIMVGIGGNDMGFGSAVETCVKAYLHSRGIPTDAPQIGAHCSDDIRANQEKKLDTVRVNLMKTIDQVRQTMTQRGYTQGSYRLMVVGYPGILANHNNYAHPESTRISHDCPFRTSDTEYLNETLTRKLNAQLHAGSHLKDVEFLDLNQVLNGHRLCEGDTQRHSSGTTAPPAATSEWLRFLDMDYTKLPPGPGRQGHENEVMHPNQYGQQAMGYCMKLAWSKPKGRFGCLGAKNKTPTQMVMVDGFPPHLVSNFVQPLKADLGKTFINRGFGVTGNPYSPANKVIVDVDIDAPFHHVFEITLESPDGKIQTVLARNAGSGGLRKTHRALLNAPADPTGVWRVRIYNHGNVSPFQDGTLHQIKLTHY